MRIHIVSIAGMMTANIAVDLVKKGHLVTGSDQEKIYPPVSNILENAGIEVNSHPITSAIDMAIIGSSYSKFSRTKDEFEQINKLSIPYISATEYLAKNTIKDKSILIAGSYGKSTITSLISWILIRRILSVAIPNGIENGITQLTQAFILFYSSKSKNTQAYQQLINSVHKNGFILVNQKDISNNQLSFPEKIQKITYNDSKSDYFIKNIQTNNSNSKITIHSPDGEYQIETSLLGNFNFENILAAFAVCHSLGINTKIIIESIKSYKGVQRRLQLIKETSQNILIDDFAQSAPRIKASIDAIKFHFPQHDIISIFEPHASFLQHISGLEDLDSAFLDSEKIILTKLRINPNKNKRIIASDYQKIIGKKLIYLPESADIIKYIKENIKTNTVIINFSSGGNTNHQLLEKIKEII